MAAIPAKVAGVGTVVLASPPDRTGKPAAIVLAAAALAGVDRVFAVGGAGAVAAMAYGTKTIPRVDRIVGPGNAYVAAAKLLVADRVGIDSPAGPSELVVIADDTSNPRVVATEMVAQAEHDPDAVVVAIAVGPKVARVIETFVADAVARAERGEIVREALRRRGGILVARDRGEAIAAANDIAAEHLLLAVGDAESLVDGVRNAGAVFVGASASVAFGDYMTGANHVLPTGGSARAYSGLSPLDFVRWTTFQSVEPDAAARLAGDVATLARAEGLPGHAAAALQWSAR
jgi:histidinol dehydrogenase